MPARCVPWPKASRWRSSGLRRVEGEVGAVDDPARVGEVADRRDAGVDQRDVDAVAARVEAVGADRAADLGERGRVGGDVVARGRGLAE